jgi:anti-anti-sigma regulatory factor
MAAVRCVEHDVPTVLIGGRSVPEESLGPRSTVGTLFAGRYVINAVIAAGPTGTHFVATQRAMDRLVALKVLHLDLLTRGKGLTRFYYEARSASLLDHPNIARIFDFGVDEETQQPYIATSFVEGQSLAALLTHGNLPEIRCAAILSDVARALVAAHARGVIHSDLRPENVMVSKRAEGGEHATVLEFGYVKLGDAPKLRASVDGAFLGAPGYMSPEQAEGGVPDYRSDLYSLGCMMHRCVAGRTPFHHETALAMIAGHLRDPPPPLPNALANGEPPSAGFDALRRWLLEKRPAKRPAGTVAVEVLAAIAEGDRPRAERLVKEAREAGEVRTVSARVPDPTTVRAEMPEIDPGEDKTDVTTADMPQQVVAGKHGVSTRITASGALVTLPAVIDERFGDNGLVKTLASRKVIVFDFEKVQRITSFGVREWVRFLKDLPESSYYCFVRCHPIAMAQFNVITGFSGRGEILSLYVPYECPGCEEHTELLIDVQREKANLEAFELAPIQCLRCNKDSQLEDPPEVYFHHVIKKPIPNPPRAALELIGANTTRETKEVAFGVTKEVGETLTIFKLKGTLDGSASLRRLADGVEGDTLIDLSEVDEVDKAGIDVIGRFLSELSSRIHLAGADAGLVAILFSASVVGSIRWGAIEITARCPRCKTRRRARIGGADGAAITCCGANVVSLAALERRVRRAQSDKHAEVEQYLQRRGGAR